MKQPETLEIKASPVWIWGFSCLCLLLLAVIYFADLNQELFFAINGFAYNFQDKLWALLTNLSDGLFTFVLLLPFVYKKPQYIWSVLLAAVLFTIFGQAVKHLLHVPRPPQVLAPNEVHLIGPDWGANAFPSGHAAMIFNLAGAFALTTSKKWLRVILICAAAFIALTRIAVGVHWPLDVVAGAALGWIMVWLGLKLAQRTPWGWGRVAQKILGAILLIACVVLFFVDYTGQTNIMREQRIFALVFFVFGASEYFKVYKTKLS
jgi:membrane-associated phospholipid phosphatase